MKGQQAALEAFAAQCAATNCPLGPDPKAAVDALLSAARSGQGPGGTSVAALTNAIVTALGFPDGDRVSTTNRLAQTLAAARSGDDTPIMNLINQAEAVRETDGQFINRCSRRAEPPHPRPGPRARRGSGPSSIRSSAASRALNLVKCLNWPSSTPPEDPKDLKIDVLLMGVQNDPIVRQRGRGRHGRHASSTPAPPASG